VPFMTRIPSDLAKFGLKVELVPGWETRGSSSFAPAGVTCHWTAGPKGTAGRPSLNICVNGRTGIPGPLCNIYLARDGTCVVVSAGRANHAGAGGFRGLVGNSAVYGIEAESGGDGDWTPAMLAAYPRLVAALLSGLGRDASWAHGHHEWAPTRKIDIRDIMPAVRSGAAQILANPNLEDDMPLNQTDLDAVYYKVQQAMRDWRDGNNRNALDLGNQLRADIYGAIGALGQTTGASPVVDPATLAAALKPMLAEAVAAGMAADNDDQADEIVDRLAARLAAPTA